jgi:Zinc-binding dehydrogenase
VNPFVADGQNKYRDQPILVIGGSSSVGQFGESYCCPCTSYTYRQYSYAALQFAKLSGFNPIITTASTRNETYVRSAGATHIIDYKNTPYSALGPAVAKITTVPMSFVFDAISTEDSQRAAWEILAPNGRLVTTLPPVVGSEAGDGKHAELVMGNSNAEENHEIGNLLYRNLTALLVDGLVKVSDFQSPFLAIIRRLLLAAEPSGSTPKWTCRHYCWAGTVSLQECQWY